MDSVAEDSTKFAVNYPTLYAGYELSLFQKQLLFAIQYLLSVPLL